MENSAANSLYQLLVTRDFQPEILDSQGKAVTNPSEAELFSFDYKTDEKNYGSVVILLGSDSNLEVYFGDNLGKTMEGDDRQEWYKFLAQLKKFATRNLLNFNLQNINRLKYTMQGMAAIKEGLFEGYYGNRKISYSDQPQKTRLVIKHSKPLGETDARYRNIDSLYVETEDGNRFRLPHRNLMAGKIMARHCAEGGTPYDIFGQHINEIVTELNTLGRFIRTAKNKGFQGNASEMIETAVRHYTELKDKAKHMISKRGYHEARESFNPADIQGSAEMVESIRTMFIEQMLDQRIEEALPILARLSRDAVPGKMKEANEFESWVNDMSEGTWALPDTRETKHQLKDLMSRELIVGPDATNARELLGDIVGDDILIDRLSDLAERDPNANIWDDDSVMSRITELVPGIDDEVDEALSGAPIGGAIEMPLEDLDTDGVMMTKPSNMSSESKHTSSLNRLIELAHK